LLIVTTLSYRPFKILEYASQLNCGRNALISLAVESWL